MSAPALRWTLIALGAVLVISLACNFILATQLQDSFQKVHFARVFPLGYAPEKLPAPAQTHARGSVTL